MLRDTYRLLRKMYDDHGALAVAVVIWMAYLGLSQKEDTDEN